MENEKERIKFSNLSIGLKIPIIFSWGLFIIWAILIMKEIVLI